MGLKQLDYQVTLLILRTSSRTRFLLLSFIYLDEHDLDDWGCVVTQQTVQGGGGAPTRIDVVGTLKVTNAERDDGHSQYTQ